MLLLLLLLLLLNGWKLMLGDVTGAAAGNIWLLDIAGTAATGVRPR
jgi:hypothetical protein